jgi:hypothetical protein
MIDETISKSLPSHRLTLEKTFTIEEVQDHLFPVHDIMHAWPKSLKDPTEYQHIASLFDPIAFWKFADPWDVTICTPPSPPPPALRQSDTFVPQAFIAKLIVANTSSRNTNVFF